MALAFAAVSALAFLALGLVLRLDGVDRPTLVWMFALYACA
jgi:hypothetical protein